MGLCELGLLQAHTALERAVRGLQGQAEADIAERTRRFFEEEVVPLFAPGGLAAVEAHKSAGAPVVLLTSSSISLGQLVAQHLDHADSLSMRFEVEDGLFTGRIAELCYGAAKVSRAEAWAADHGVDLDQCWFYSDSMSDLPMLERVARPMVVAPDPRLSRLARKRGWPVLDWSDTGASPA